MRAAGVLTFFDISPGKSLIASSKQYFIHIHDNDYVLPSFYHTSILAT